MRERGSQYILPCVLARQFTVIYNGAFSRLPGLHNCKSSSQLKATSSGYKFPASYVHPHRPLVGSFQQVAYTHSVLWLEVSSKLRTPTSSSGWKFPASYVHPHHPLSRSFKQVTPTLSFG